jgi:hypothetical protein
MAKHGLAGPGHQPRRHPHHPLPGGQQVAFQPPADMAAVLYGPQPLVWPAAACPAEQLDMAEVRAATVVCPS